MRTSNEWGWSRRRAPLVSRRRRFSSALGLPEDSTNKQSCRNHKGRYRRCRGLSIVLHSRLYRASITTVLQERWELTED